MIGNTSDGEIQLKAGNTVEAEVALGPVTHEMVLEMAGLTRDYHPWRVVAKAAAQSGPAKMLLQEVWISGLAAAQLPSLLPGSTVRAIELAYRSHMHVGEILKLRMVVRETGSEEGRKAVSFEVVDRSGRIVAEGTARMESRSNETE